jgi:hypothetical protein
MPPAKPKTKGVKFTVMNVPVSYSEEDGGYVLDLTDIDADEHWKVLDFTETWSNESGILTVVVTRG